MMTQAAPPAAASGTYTAQDLARLLCCSLRHVRSLDAQGSIPGRVELGRLIRFSRRQVDAWLDGNTQPQLRIRH